MTPTAMAEMFGDRPFSERTANRLMKQIARVLNKHHRLGPARSEAAMVMYLLAAEQWLATAKLDPESIGQLRELAHADLDKAIDVAIAAQELIRTGELTVDQGRVR